MSDKLGEELSALVDGEMSEFGLRKVLSELDDKPEMIDKWGRYHLARGVYRQEAVFCDDLSARVRNALAEESPLSENTIAQKSEYALGRLRDKFYKPLSTAALAAFVSVVSVTVWQSLQPNNISGDDSLIAIHGSGTLSPLENNLSKTTPVRSGNDSYRDVSAPTGEGDTVVSNPPASHYLSPRRLEVYMISHANHVSVMNPSGMMPFARVVSKKAEK